MNPCSCRFVLLCVGILLIGLLIALGCSSGDDDEEEDTGDLDDDTFAGDDDTFPDPGACLCCYTDDGEIWGYCWLLTAADECDPGCRTLYDDDHFIDVQFFEATACADLDADALCRE